MQVSRPDVLILSVIIIIVSVQVRPSSTPSSSSFEGEDGYLVRRQQPGKLRPPFTVCDDVLHAKVQITDG